MTVLGRSLALVALSLAVGLLAAASSTRVLEALLYEVDPPDLTTFGVVSAMMTAVVLAASLLPAWRAAAVDPASTLRQG